MDPAVRISAYAPSIAAPLSFPYTRSQNFTAVPYNQQSCNPNNQLQRGNWILLDRSVNTFSLIFNLVSLIAVREIILLIDDFDFKNYNMYVYVYAYEHED